MRGAWLIVPVACAAAVQAVSLAFEEYRHRREERRSRERECRACNGSGHCQECGGTGQH